MKDIDKFIKELETEILKVEDSLQREIELARLESALRDYRGEDKLISSMDVADRIRNAPEEKKILTGIKGLDDILKGFRLRQLVVMAAATKSGKTSFCIELTSRLKAENPMWLPFEEGADELVQKFLDRGEEPPLFYTPDKMTGNTLNWVEKKIIEAKAKFGTNIIFIDHLHFIVPFSAERSDLRIGETMRDLKRIAKDWNVTIVLIAHLKKTKMEMRPNLEDLRDSSFIAQEADTVIMLWRETKMVEGDVEITNNVNVSVQANRRTGKTGNVKMVYSNGRFLEEDWNHKMEKEFNDY